MRCQLARLDQFLLLLVLLLLTPACSRVQLTSPVKLRIGTRGSPLALAQAHETKNLLRRTFPELQPEGAIEITRINTEGDSVLNQQLHSIGGKGLFTKELDMALLNKEVDICVHSMKDVPTTLPGGTVLPCILERQPTNDVFISEKYKTLQDLPDKAIIGTSSLRRKAQILAINPTFKVVMFRGNVQTRLRKIESGLVDGTLLALAGLQRLGMSDLVKRSQCVPRSLMLPAVAQGAIGIQCRSNDTKIINYLKQLNHCETKLCVDCERAFLKGLDGNCRTPIAGQASIENGILKLRGFLSKADGSESVFVDKSGSPDEFDSIGQLAALDIKTRLGTKKFMEYQITFSDEI